LQRLERPAATGKQNNAGFHEPAFFVAETVTVCWSDGTAHSWKADLTLLPLLPSQNRAQSCARPDKRHDTDRRLLFLEDTFF